MPSEAKRALASPLFAVRRERVHTTMLVELLALMVFMAMTFAFVQKEQDARINPLAAVVKRLNDEIGKLRRDLTKVQVENRALASENRILTEANRSLFAQLKGTLPATDPPVALTKSQLDKLNSDLARAKEQNRALGIENARLGGKGVGLPNCLTGGGYYVRVTTSLTGYRASLMAKAGAYPAPGVVDGMVPLIAAGELSEADFRRLAARIRVWGESQETPCKFSAKIQETHSNLSLYKKQYANVARYFNWGN